MALDNSNFINQMNISQPDGATDLVSSIDDHIREVKRAIKQTLPYLDKQVNLTADQMNALKDTFTIAGTNVNISGRYISNAIAVDLDNAYQPRSYNDGRYALRSQPLNWVVDRYTSMDHLLGGLNGSGAGFVNLRNIMVNTFFPIGSIYLSMSANNPGNYMGGVWSLQAQGRALVGAGSNGTDNISAGQTFGKASVNLTIANLPPHQHGLENFITTSFGGGSSGPRQAISVDTGTWHGHDYRGTRTTDSVGSGGAFSIYQPSLGVYVWQRIG